MPPRRGKSFKPRAPTPGRDPGGGVREAAKDRGEVPGKDFNPGHAVWCEEHQRLECNSKNHKYDRRCHAAAIHGLNKCGIHSGGAGGRLKAMAIGQAQITAWKFIGVDGKPLPGAIIDPGQAVMAQLQVAWFRAGAYAEMLRQQIEREALKAQKAAALAAPVLDEDGNPVSDALAGVGGLVGHNWSMSEGGKLYATSEQVRALADLEARERDRVVAYAEKAHKMGISARMTSLAEQWGNVTAGRFLKVLDGLELTPAQQAKSVALVQQHLSSIDLTGVGD